MNQDVDLYLLEGCGRCSLGGTPDCKVHQWPNELAQLRRIVLECGLTETLKWGVPVYTFQNTNVVIVAAFKNYAALSFFKGVLLQDTHSMLDKPGEHTQSGRLIRFTRVQNVLAQENILKDYIYEAIEVEKAGLKVDFNTSAAFTMPDEFQEKLSSDKMLKSAFEALTPGRQRAYLLHFSAAKQSTTRISRIEKCIPLILRGKGINEG